MEELVKGEDVNPAEAVLEEMRQEMSLPWCPANAWWQVGHASLPVARGSSGMAAESGIKSGNGTIWLLGNLLLVWGGSDRN